MHAPPTPRNGIPAALVQEVQNGAGHIGGNGQRNSGADVPGNGINNHCVGNND